MLQYCKSPIISLLFTISWLCCPQFSTEHLNSLGSNFNVNGLTLQLKSLRRLSLVYRGGQLTSLMHRLPDVLRFEEHRQKHRPRCFFQKHHQNIASLRKKHDVLHDVFGFRNSIQSYDKSLVI